MKESIQRQLHTEIIRNYENQPDSDKKIDVLCKLYIFIQKNCYLFLKSLEEIIANKKINTCYF